MPSKYTPEQIAETARRNAAAAAEDDLRDQAGRDADAMRAKAANQPAPPAFKPAAAPPSSPSSPAASAKSAVPDYSGVINDIKSGYDTQRQKAAAAEGRNLQNARDAINRRAAQLGGGPSGAIIGVEQNAENDSAQRVQQANADINQAQSQDLRGIEMTKKGQEFQAGQQQAGIDAQKAMQLTGLNAQSSLQDRQIAAQKLMQMTGIDAQKAMQLTGQNFQSSEADKARQTQIDQFMKSYGLEERKFAEQTQVDQFNEKIAELLANKKDFMDRALGPLTPSGGQGGFGSGMPSFMDSWSPSSYF